MAFVRGCGRRKLRGAGGFMDFVNGVGNFAKKALGFGRNSISSGSGRRSYTGRRRLKGSGMLGQMAGRVLAGLLLGHGRRRLQGGSAHYRTAQLLDINPHRTRIARLRKAF